MRIFMPVRFRGIWRLNLAALLVAAFFGFLAWLSFTDGDAGLGAGFLLLIFLLAAMESVQLFYGLRITPRHVIAFSQDGVECIPYSEVSKITVIFRPDSVKAVIRSRGKDYDAIWSYIRLSSPKSIFDVVLWVKLNDSLVEKSIAKLSQCPKVVIENRFHEEHRRK